MYLTYTDILVILILLTINSFLIYLWLPKIIQILISIFNDFWMVWESKKHGFGVAGLGGTRFLARLVFGWNVGRKSEVLGAKNCPESELWSEKSGPKFDKNSRTKNRGSKIEKSEGSGGSATNDRRHFGSQGPRKWTLSLITRHF